MEHLQRMERLIVNLRWWFIVGAVLVLSIYYEPFKIEDISLLTFIGIPLVAIGYNGLATYMTSDELVYRRSHRFTAYFTRGFDTILISSILVSNPHYFYDFYLSYAFVIIGAAMVYQLRGSLVVAGMITAVYSGLIMVEDLMGGPHLAIHVFLLRIVFFFATALIGGLLAREVGEERKKREKIEKLAALYEIGKTLGSPPNVERLLNQIVDSALRETRASKGYLMVLDNRTNKLVVRVSRGLDEEMSKQLRIGMGEWIEGQVMEQGEPVLIEDVGKDERFRRSKVLSGVKSLLSVPLQDTSSLVARMRILGDMESVLSVPLQTQDGILGTITVVKEHPNETFTQDDMDLLTTLASQAAMALENAHFYESLESDYFKNYIYLLAAALEAKDPYTRGHSENVTGYALAIAEEMDLSGEARELIERVGLVHDIGKIGISDAILQKPGSLTEAEWEIIRQHPVIGEGILKVVPSLRKALPLVRYHHERVDGRGYPDGLVKDEIPVVVRIMVVADAYDALISERSYRKAKSPQEAIAELKRCAGTQFDKEVVEALCRCFEKGRLKPFKG